MDIRKTAQSLKTRFGIVRSFFGFLWANKMWWAIPMMLVILVFFIFILFAQSSPLAVFIYPLL